MSIPVYTLEASIVPEQAKPGEMVTMTARFELLEGDLAYAVMHVANYDIWERFSRVSDTHYELAYHIPHEAPLGNYRLDICGVSSAGMPGPNTTLFFNVLT